MEIDQLRNQPVYESVYASLKAYGKPVGPQELVMRTVREHIESDHPIPFVGFWGIGKKQDLDENDRRFLEMLSGLQAQITQHHQPGARITVILADMHGVFNGEVLRETKAPAVARYRRLFHNAHAPYLAKVASALKEKGMQAVWLSDLYMNHGLEIPNIYDPIDESSEAYEILTEEDQGRHESYLESARHNRRGVPRLQAAYHYIRERLQEKPMLPRAFPGHIFFVNGGRNLALRVVPEGLMSILYLREGPVWFQDKNQKGGENL